MWIKKGKKKQKKNNFYHLVELLGHGGVEHDASDHGAHQKQRGVRHARCARVLARRTCCAAQAARCAAEAARNLQRTTAQNNYTRARVAGEVGGLNFQTSHPDPPPTSNKNKARGGQLSIPPPNE